MPRAYYDDLQPGQEWGTHTWVASPEICAAWQQATGDESPLYHDTEAARISPYKRPIVPPSLAFVYLSQGIQELLREKPPGGVHQKQQLTFFAPAYVGDVLTTSLTVLEKYVKRERKYVVFRTVTVNQRGEKVLEGVRISIWAA